MASPVRSRAVAALSLLVLAGCESPQDPEPLEKTVPTAAAIVGLWAVVVGAVAFSVVRWIRRRREAAIVRQPVAVSLLTIVPAIVATAPLVLGLAWVVAVGYREPTTSMFDWDATVGFHIIVAGTSALAVVAAAAVSVLATHPNRVVVAIGQLVLAVPAGAMTVSVIASEPSFGSFLGLAGATPWTVAFVLTWYQRPATPSLPDQPRTDVPAGGTRWYS